MDIHSLRFKKQVLLILSLTIGFVLSFEEWELVARQESNHSYWLYVAVAVVQFAFFALFAWTIWYINLYSKLKNWKVRLLLSLLILGVLLIFGEQLIEPWVDDLNDLIRYKRGRHGHLRHDDWDEWVMKTILLFAICYISSILIQLIKHKREIEQNMERLQKEALQSQINALTNQINPHFFFNSLNSLYSLVLNNNTDKSLAYISKMSDVFRYILQSEEKRLVSLAEELRFLDTYLFMLKVKYDSKLTVSMSNLNDYETYALPVLSLLPLIENVIKHNEISKQHPMDIRIFVDDERNLTVSNHKVELLDAAKSVGVGLKNLNDRFKLITEREIEIEDTGNEFTVRLPLIKSV